VVYILHSDKPISWFYEKAACHELVGVGDGNGELNREGRVDFIFKFLFLNRFLSNGERCSFSAFTQNR